MEKNLLKGDITRSLVYFSIPLVIGNLLQQLYNVIDTFIVGKYLGADALGAVGASFTLMTFLTSIILGLCMGSGVLFSIYYGAKKYDDMKTAFFVSFISIGTLALFIEGMCLLCIHSIMRFINIPLDVYQLTYHYLFVVFMGMFFTFLFNYFSSLLRALGNSKTPLYFLGLSAIINIILDIYFIAVLKMDTAGAALATIIAQAVSALSLMIYVYRKEKHLLPEKKHMHMNIEIFMKIQNYSLMTCLQQSIMNFGILMIQGLVNSFGVAVMSAFSVAVKIDAFAYMPVQDFGNAFSTFIAQNKGARQEERIQQGIWKSFKIATMFCIFISMVVYIFAPELMQIFIDVSKNNIIQLGADYLRIEGMCYVGIGWLFLLYGYYRGIGKPLMSVILTIASLGTRVLLSYMFVHQLGLHIIWWSIPIGWFFADSIGIGYGLIKEKWLLWKV